MVERNVFTVLDVTDAVEVTLSIFIEQVLSPRSDYFHRVVRIKESTRLPAIEGIRVTHFVHMKKVIAKVTDR